MGSRRTMRALTAPPLVAAAFLFVVLEEAFWAVSRPLAAAIGRIPFMRPVELAVAALPAHAVFCVFLLPMAALFPVKLAAFWLVGTGHVVAGGALLVGAKILGTAVSTRLYQIARPKLMTIPVFARGLAWAVGMRDRAHAWLDAHPSWVAAKRAAATAVASARGLAARLRGRGPSAAPASAAARFARRRI